jgi:hypothetical protein
MEELLELVGRTSLRIVRQLDLYARNLFLKVNLVRVTLFFALFEIGFRNVMQLVHQ